MYGENHKGAKIHNILSQKQPTLILARLHDSELDNNLNITRVYGNVI
jgi:hypothetical protein